MEKKLEALEEKYASLAERLESTEIMSDMAAYAKCMKEYKALTPIIDKYHEYKTALADLKDAEEIAAETDDAEMRALAQEQSAQSRLAIDRCLGELKLLLLPRDPNDDKNVIVEIRSGAGGDEAALFAYELYRMYTMYAEKCGFKTELLYVNETELKGFKEVSFMIVGEGAYSKFKFESGVHRVQRVPETESQGRIHTSTVTVAVLPEAEDFEFELNMDELEITTHRSAGAGGQHVNKTDSAIRITHLPTGIVVGCQTERSQVQNRETAMRMLKSKLLEIKEREKLERIEDITGAKLNIEWGSQIRSYVFMPYTLVKDNRTGWETGNITAVMDGEIDDFINEYLKMISKTK